MKNILNCNAILHPEALAKRASKDAPQVDNSPLGRAGEEIQATARA
jgi:hypothetical protein